MFKSCVKICISIFFFCVLSILEFRRRSFFFFFTLITKPQYFEIQETTYFYSFLLETDEHFSVCVCVCGRIFRHRPRYRVTWMRRIGMWPTTRVCRDCAGRRRFGRRTTRGTPLRARRIVRRGRSAIYRDPGNATDFFLRCGTSPTLTVSLCV